MALYLVKLRRELEFENYYKCDSEELAIELAKLEAGVQATIVDEQVIATEIDPAMVDQ